MFASDERPTVPWWRSALLLRRRSGWRSVSLPSSRAVSGVLPRCLWGCQESADRWGTRRRGPCPEELLNTIWPAFSGILGQYWGRNFFKLHSEYLGVVVLVLATFAPYLRDKRRLAWFFVLLAAYGMLFALGAYPVLPHPLRDPPNKLTRAPSMILHGIQHRRAGRVRHPGPTRRAGDP